MRPTDSERENITGDLADYPRLLSEVKERIRSAQYAALKAVNTELVGLYWDIGRMMLAAEQPRG